MTSLTARDLMKPAYLRLGAGHSLREALSILLDTQLRRDQPRVLIILNADGSFGGILTTRYLLRAILPEWIAQGVPEGEAFESKLMEALSGKLEMPVNMAMNADVPPVLPEDRLLRLISIMRDKRLDCVPVMEGKHVMGVVYLADVFNAAARLALSAQA